MAQRRMFSKDITENDAFLDMPLSSQALYFHLGMQSDDDGFVSPNRIVRMLGCQTDDLKILIAKKFVLPFEDGVVVIKHWLINNYIQKDRYKPTTHQDKLAQLSIKSNNGYKMNTECIQNVRLGKVRLGKVRLDKESQEGDKSRRFTPPSLQEVTDYCNERNNTVDPEAFINHYQSNGWFRGKTKIKDWRACVRTWEKTVNKLRVEKV